MDPSLTDNSYTPPDIQQLQQHNNSLPTDAAMSQPQAQTAGDARQPISYPSPNGFESTTGINPANAQYPAYPVANQQAVAEPYRESPTGSNPSLNLPSMRSLDPMQPQQQQQQPVQQHHQQQQMAAPLPPPVPQMGPYYPAMPHPSHQYPGVTTDPNGQNMRYAIPQPDRVMSGGRHKKEIKRRTKTGCLTCRKRRIKCDEQHPACRNCQKSKRECLGYDPIFKQQPGPSPIQPAPTGAPPQQPTLVTSANPYGDQPQMLQGYAQVPNLPYDPSLAQQQSYEYSTAIDPALEAVAQAAPPPGANPYIQGTPTFQLGANIYNQTYKTDERNGQDTTASYYPVHNPASAPQVGFGGQTDANASYQNPDSLLTFSEDIKNESAITNTSHAAPVPMKFPVNVEELLMPLPVKGDFHPEGPLLEEIKHIYLSIYTAGLEAFFETRFYSTKGLEYLLKDAATLEQCSILLSQFAKPQTDPAELQYTHACEGRVVWSLANLVRKAADEELVKYETKPEDVKPEGTPADIPEQPSTDSTATTQPSPKPSRIDHTGAPALEDPIETSYRLSVFEHLVSGTIAPSNPLVPRPMQGDHHKLRELEFWNLLGKFVTLRFHDNVEGGSDAKAVDETLQALRNLLDGRENRDVLYSIAVVRAIGQRVSEYELGADEPLHLDEQDTRSKLLVAKRFVRDEGNGNGTTNVIRRFCELASRPWA